MASQGLKLTDALADALAESVSLGVPIETACQAAGVHPNTFYNWLRAGKNGVWDTGETVAPESMVMLGRFVERIAQAQAQWEAQRVLNIVKTASTVNEKTGLKDWRAEAWLLNNHPRTRERYRQHKEVQIESNSTVTHEHRMVAGLTIDQLDKLESDLALPSGTTDT